MFERQTNLILESHTPTLNFVPTSKDNWRAGFQAVLQSFHLQILFTCHAVLWCGNFSLKLHDQKTILCCLFALIFYSIYRTCWVCLPRVVDELDGKIINFLSFTLISSLHRVVRFVNLHFKYSLVVWENDSFQFFSFQFLWLLLTNLSIFFIPTSFRIIINMMCTGALFYFENTQRTSSLLTT